MDILQAKELVIQAGKQLVASGLIARTWGNVSCRVSDTQFVITPSGRLYESLQIEDIVLVTIADLHYEGTVKPSSEKGIHAAAYRLRKDIHFVIHTHQNIASMAGILGKEIPLTNPQSYQVIKEKIPTAPYGLPGTKKLCKGVSDTLAKFPGKAILLAHHGALCLGKDLDEAFSVAEELETVCRDYLFATCTQRTGKKTQDFSLLEKYFRSAFHLKAENQNVVSYCLSRREGESLVFFDQKGSKVEQDVLGNEELVLHQRVYASRPDISCIIHVNDSSVLALCETGKTWYPLLDDFAQIVGVSVKTVDPRKKRALLQGLSGRNAVFLLHGGALCCGGTLGDAEAVASILTKNSKAQIASSLFGNIKPINSLDSRLMRFVYTVKYSRQAGK
ncbi:class II aldolase/adducin family protein [uncultured Sphaerochaeta sp.]|uniref:class II aldolase/adducin family protein n=1 Tax=uncultured Sphaerochaeta sp. TaxID=886478 RepID=UPI002A0A6546|nr:class II aldolase/adducin family protein [uncultured Sphaerochaeta sp.]